MQRLLAKHGPGRAVDQVPLSNDRIDRCGFPGGKHGLTVPLDLAKSSSAEHLFAPHLPLQPYSNLPSSAFVSLVLFFFSVVDRKKSQRRGHCSADTYRERVPRSPHDGTHLKDSCARGG